MSQMGAVLSRLDGIRKSGNGYSARCPAETHGGDRNPSLSVGEGESGRVLLTCHKGCLYDDIIAGINLTSRDIAGTANEVRPEWTPFGEAVAVYDYPDENGRLLFQVLRTADKQFPARVADKAKKSGWTWRLGDTRRVLYRLPKVIAAVDAGQPILLVEGEKDVQAAEAVGAVATCNPGGAGKWRTEYNDIFRDAEVTIVADRDKPGGKHAREVFAALSGVARGVRIVEPVEGKDLSDHLAAGRTLYQLVPITGTDEPKPDLAPDIYDLLDTNDPGYDWLVPDLIERGDRLILTGAEGLGKSFLVRQLAATMAAGLHPFTFAKIEPLRVLLIDCENSLRQTRRLLARLEYAARRSGAKIPSGNLRIILRPEGINLLAEDAEWLLERVIAHKPDVLFVGPLYRLHITNMNDELPARRMVAALDAARVRANCALVLEAHAGHGEVGAGFGGRAVRPTGSSLFLRWPEFGYGLRIPKDAEGTTVADVVPWRGPRDERTWPERLCHGAQDSWPWLEDKPISAWGAA
jgi:hypothetical protein